MKTATRIRDCNGFRGTAALYKLSEPVRTGWTDDDSAPMTDYVVASSISNEFGVETLVFPAKSDGKVSSWGEVGGGRGYQDLDRAIREMGYELAP